MNKFIDYIQISSYEDGKDSYIPKEREWIARRTVGLSVDGYTKQSIRVTGLTDKINKT